MARAIVLVLDSFGIGATADAESFGDSGSDTLGHIAAQRAAAGQPLRLPNLGKLGLFHAGRESTGSFAAGADPDTEITGAYGHAAELSSGKDTPSGHWEIAGVPVLFDWGYFTDRKNTFPPELIDALLAGEPGEAVRTELESVQRVWSARVAEAASEIELLETRIRRQQARERSLIETLSDLFSRFWRTRGLNLLLAALAFLGSMLALAATAMPAAQAVVPLLVPPEHFANAVAWSTMGFSAARIAERSGSLLPMMRSKPLAARTSSRKA